MLVIEEGWERDYMENLSPSTQLWYESKTTLKNKVYFLKSTHASEWKYSLSSSLFFFFKYIFLFIYFWLRWVFVAACRLSLVAASRGYSSLWCMGFSLRSLLLLPSTGSRAQTQKLWRTGLVAPRHVGSSPIRAKPVSPALAGGFLTTAPPEKSLPLCF